ncbi:hypothetical protein ABE067_18730 [Bacillus safensis]
MDNNKGYGYLIGDEQNLLPKEVNFTDDEIKKLELLENRTCTEYVLASMKLFGTKHKLVAEVCYIPIGDIPVKLTECAQKAIDAAKEVLGDNWSNPLKWPSLFTDIATAMVNAFVSCIGEEARDSISVSIKHTH